ncbi:MAG: GNAT family N-acetyltransferase [Geminicoccaceae bacterium]
MKYGQQNIVCQAGPETNAACGQLVGRSAGEAIYVAKIAFAKRYIADKSPLELPASYRRLVICRKGEIRGLIQFELESGYIKYLFTDPDYECQGIGSALLGAAETMIAGRSWLSVLWVNDRGLIWYARRGYHVFASSLEADWHGGPVLWLDMEKKPEG